MVIDPRAQDFDGGPDSEAVPTDGSAPALPPTEQPPIVDPGQLISDAELAEAREQGWIDDEPAGG